MGSAIQETASHCSFSRRLIAEVSGTAITRKTMPSGSGRSSASIALDRLSRLRQRMPEGKEAAPAEPAAAIFPARPRASRAQANSSRTLSGDSLEVLEYPATLWSRCWITPSGSGESSVHTLLDAMRITGEYRDSHRFCVPFQSGGAVASQAVLPAPIASPTLTSAWLEGDLHEALGGKAWKLAGAPLWLR